jgi:hypothetical protein
MLPQSRMSPGLPAPDAGERFLVYAVHVVVDNSDGYGAPVILEDTRDTAGRASAASLP